jgi:hypothetical protein
MRLAIRACALFIIVAFATQTVWAGGHGSGNHSGGSRAVHVNGDHIVPLKRGGCDCPSNMQWQTREEAKAKDKWE